MLIGTRRAPCEHRCWQEYQEELKRGDVEVMGGLVDRHNQQHFKRTSRYPVMRPKVPAKLLGNRVVLIPDLANGLEKQPIPVVVYGAEEEELKEIRKMLPTFTYQAVRAPPLPSHPPWGCLLGPPLLHSSAIRSDGCRRSTRDTRQSWY
jgi:hypothetical protein